MMTLIRVRYGKKDTPREMREYQIDGKGPVGCLDEYKEQFPKEKFRVIDNITKCPRCQKEYIEYPAISRRDNVTKICIKCGMEEAMFDFAISTTKKDRLEIDNMIIDEKAWLRFNYCECGNRIYDDRDVCEDCR